MVFFIFYPNSISSDSQAYIFLAFLTSNWSLWILSLCPNLNNISPWHFFGCLLLPYLVFYMSFDLIFFPLNQILQFYKVFQQRHPIIISKFVTIQNQKKSSISCTKLCIYIHVTTNMHIQQNWFMLFIYKENTLSIIVNTSHKCT